MVEETSLYFHIPFCRRKCDYCHFYVIPDQERFKINYMEALQKEWKQRLPLLEGKSIVSIYFGGGTPALLGPERISTILQWLPLQNNPEITLEANPENASPSLFKSYFEAGVNRLSIGVQTFDEGLLKLLGREHSANQSEKAVLFAHQAGLSNISIDLMYDLPGQTLEEWEKTLNRALKLPITHLSLYNLTIEPHTVFFKKQTELKPRLPTPETSFQMLELALEKCEKKGLYRYEISAFAKPSHYSRHNTGYWTGRPFLGFGPSAYSYWEGSRFRNTAHLNHYCKLVSEGASAVDFSETLSPSASIKEHIAVRLRLLEGIPLKYFPTLPLETQNTLRKFEALAWLVFDSTSFRLTSKGLLFHDSIAEELIE